MPVLAHRSASTVVKSLFQLRHYQAFLRMMMLSGNSREIFHRYVTGKGEYPFQCEIKTPLSSVQATLYSYYDLLTLNEIFFRRDYPAGPHDKVIVDIGSNIGLSALYFLTRNPSAMCVLYEPDPRNVQRIKSNLADFLGRWDVNEKAVSDKAGSFQFGIDETSGRYGGLDVNFGKTIQVEVLHINTVLEGVIRNHGFVDILKIDTEGSEIATVQAIESELLKKIKKIYMEARPDRRLHSWFTQEQSGTVCRMINQRPV